jgi:hypothetical protein
VRTLILLFLVSAPALAWEPASPAEVQARIGELTQAWAGKTAEQIAQDKVARARQQRPAWAAKSAWKLELGPLTYYLAVGKAPADSAGTAGAAGPAGASSGAAPAPAAKNPAPPVSGRPLDWWYDEASGALYTLVVDAR